MRGPMDYQAFTNGILREQFRASLGEPHEGPGLMQPEPAVGDGEIEARLVLGGAAAFPEEGQVDLLDVDTAVLNRLDRACDLQEPACGFLGVGEWSVGGVLHHAVARRLGTLAPSKSGLTSPPRWPQTLQVKRGSRSESRTSS